MASANFGTSNESNVHPAQKKKMDKIANTAGNQVYEWKWDSVDRVKSSEEVQYLFEEANLVFAEELKKNPTWDETALRHNVQQSHQKFTDFANTHPYFFEKATTKPPAKPDDTDPDYNEKMTKYTYETDLMEKTRKLVCFMLQIRKMVEDGRMTQIAASQIVQSFNIQNCKTNENYDEYKARMKQEQ